MESFVSQFFAVKGQGVVMSGEANYAWMGGLPNREQKAQVSTTEDSLRQLAVEYMAAIQTELSLPTKRKFCNASYEPLLKETLPLDELRRLAFDVECDDGLPGKRVGADVPIEFINIIQEAVREFYKDFYVEASHFEVCITARKPGRRIHVHFPRIVDYPKNMILVVSKVVAALNTIWPRDDWTTIMDKSIYNNGGLRTLWSSKPRFGKGGTLKAQEPMAQRFYLPYTKEMELMRLGDITADNFREASIIPSDEQLDAIKEITGRLNRRVVVKSESMATQLIPSKRKNDQLIAAHIRVPIYELVTQAGGPLEFEKIVPLLLHMGFKGLKERARRGQGVSFDADRSCVCVVCKTRIHTSNDWLVTRVVGECFSVRNYSSNCTTQLIGFEQSETLRNILRFPNADADYAQLFVTAVRGCLFWTGSEGSKRFVHFAGHTWKTMATEEVTQYLSRMLAGVLERLSKAISEQRHALETAVGLTAEEKKTKKAEIEVNYKSSLSGMVYVRRAKNVRAIIDLVKSHLINTSFERTLDTNGSLLGMNNGVVDLGSENEVPFFRPGEAEDMISRSTGYDYIDPSSELWDAAMNLRVKQFIERIYPIQEERDFVQRWSGYCLLGKHTEKFFAVFSDSRGGGCGKSKSCLMLRSSLGPEYCKDGGNNALLYENQNNFTTVNSHSSGMLAFKGVRLCLFEELTPTRKLDNAVLKKYNGGTASFEGREARAAGDTWFEWMCKMILNANENQFPGFDWTDAALLARLLVIHHRSKFYSDPVEFEAHKHEARTFLAEDVDTLIVGAWRPYVLHWALEGLASYHKVKLTKVPASCMGFKQELIAQQDTVSPWLAENIQHTGLASDRMIPRQAWNLFNEAQDGIENKRKVKMGEFNICLTKLVGALPDRQMIDGVRQKAVIGWKLLLPCV